MLSISTLFSRLHNAISLQQNSSDKNQEVKQKNEIENKSDIQKSTSIAKDTLDLSSIFQMNRFSSSFQTYSKPVNDRMSINEGTMNEEMIKIEKIRDNKNAVLARVNELLIENEIELPEDQKFQLNLNFQTSLFDISGIENTEIQQKFLEAIQGDGQLAALMRKTREDLGMDYGNNVTPGNFGIEFDSLLETPADVEVSYRIDVNIESAAKSEQAKAAGNSEVADASGPAKPVSMRMSLFLSLFAPSHEITESFADDFAKNKSEWVSGNVKSEQISWMSQQEEDAKTDSPRQTFNRQTWSSVSMSQSDGSMMYCELFTSETIGGLPNQIQNGNNMFDDLLLWLKANSAVA